MPIRRILTIVREQYASLQKRFGSNSEKKESSAAPVATENVEQVNAESNVDDVVADEAPITDSKVASA